MPHPNSIRCFLALYPDPGALRAMTEFLFAIRDMQPSVKWEKPTQIHVTMKFIAEIPRDAVTAIEMELRGTLRDEREVGAVLDRVGGFPNLAHPRIVWIGFSSAQPALLRIHKICETACATQGIKPEPRAFTPHFTIGRVKDHARPVDLEKDIEACSFAATPVHFASVRIMQSTLSPTGAIHTELARIPLAQPPTST
jgi:RNA 2',3'-cyclic 3'-phosphodiesterase